LIGRKGETLAALQRIVRLIVGSRFARWVHLVVDVDGYKQRREESLRRLAGRMAEEAVRSGRTVVLEPMPPYERRIVHLALREDVDVRTQSVGTGNRRRVTIIPQEDERPEDTHTGESTP
jgi:spoIIIJ-associated protein